MENDLILQAQLGSTEAFRRLVVLHRTMPRALRRARGYWRPRLSSGRSAR
jgi:hypothetical protein